MLKYSGFAVLPQRKATRVVAGVACCAVLCGAVIAWAATNSSARNAAQYSVAEVDAEAAKSSTWLRQDWQYETDMADCMHNQGFQYTVQLTMQHLDEAEELGDYISPTLREAVAQREQYPNMSIMKSAPQGVEAWQEALWTCYDVQNEREMRRFDDAQDIIRIAAYDEMVREGRQPVSPRTGSARAEWSDRNAPYEDAIEEYVATRPEVIAAEKDFASCVTDKGFPATHQQDFWRQYFPEGSKVPIDVPYKEQQKFTDRALEVDIQCSGPLDSQRGDARIAITESAKEGS